MTIKQMLRRHRVRQLRKQLQKYQDWLDFVASRYKTNYDMFVAGGLELVQHVSWTKKLVKQSQRKINWLEHVS